MKKMIALALMALSFTSAAEAKCIKGQFQLDLTDLGWTAEGVEGHAWIEKGEAKISFELDIAADKKTARFVSKVANANDEVRLQKGGVIRINQITNRQLQPQDIILDEVPVRCPCLVFATKNADLKVDFESMNDENVKDINYLNFIDLPVTVTSVSETCSAK